MNDQFSSNPFRNAYMRVAKFGNRQRHQLIKPMHSHGGIYISINVSVTAGGSNRESSRSAKEVRKGSAMTYCVAMKGQFGVVIAADSAVTSDAPPRLELSSFGEKHARRYGRETGPFVKEEMLKIEVIGECAVTFAGDLDEIERILAVFRGGIEAWVSPLDAFKAAAQKAASPSKAQIILGYRKDAAPRIATFNANSNGEVIDDVEYASFGSMKDVYQELTAKYFRVLTENNASSSRILVQIIALLQSYGIHDYLIEDGVGGGFCGVAMDSSGVHWQPDILFVVAHPELEHVGYIGSFARDNCWCMFSSLTTAGTIVFFRGRSGSPRELLRQEIKSLVAEMEAKHDDARFDYVCALSNDRHSVTVIELLGNRQHPLIVIESAAEKEATLGIFWSPQIRDLLNEITEPVGYVGEPHDISLRFFPYRRPSQAPDGFWDDVRAHGQHFTPPSS